MIYKKFTIAHYRGFQDEQELSLATPVSGKLGSGITYIVGENNTGKTTVLEGLFLHDQQKIRSSERQTTGFPTFQLYDHEGLKRKVTLLRENSYTLKEDPKITESDAFEMIPSRRHWVSSVQDTWSIEQLTNSTIKETPRSAVSNIKVSNVLKNIEADDDLFSKFTAYVQRVLPEFSSFAIGYEENEFIEYFTKEGVRHKSDFLGDGVISILRILAHLFAENERPLVIDEPELSLHPLAQKRLLKLMAECSEKRQIIISTHSPYFVSWEYIKNGAVLNKITKHDDKKSEINSICDYSLYESLVNGANWKQPFLMDIVAKEIFFHDNFLFVEGQEDIGLLKQDKQLSGTVNLFGYGVRGKDAFEFALRLAQDLGIKRAGVILDAGESESIIKSKLENDFPNYKVVQWEKEDIRDKEAYPAKEKVGYFDKNGEKKTGDELGDFNSKIVELNKYFD